MSHCLQRMHATIELDEVESKRRQPQMLTEFKSFLEACISDKKFNQLDSFKDMMSDIEDTHYFIIPEIFSSDEEGDAFIEKHIDHLGIDGIKIPETLDMPFKRCYFQCQSNSTTITNSVTFEEIAELRGLDKRALNAYMQKEHKLSIEDFVSRVRLNIYSIYVYELAPKYIRVVATVEVGNDASTDIDIVPISFSFNDGKLGIGNSDFNYLYEIMVTEVALSVVKIFETLNHKSWTVISNETPVKVKARTGRNLTKYKYKPSTIVYVSSKQKFCTRHPELSHRIINKPNYAYEVRGHWRRLQYHQIGKDRDGARGVKGFTWVIPFTKGEGEVMKKVRIVK